MVIHTDLLNILSRFSSPIRTAEDFEAVVWATGFANKHGCIVGLLKETGSVFCKSSHVNVRISVMFSSTIIDVH